MATYEKGVENQTKACGTGAVAVAYALMLKENSSEVKVEFSDEESVRVIRTEEGMRLKGGAVFVFQGTVRLEG